VFLPSIRRTISGTNGLAARALYILALRVSASARRRFSAFTLRALSSDARSWYNISGRALFAISLTKLLSSEPMIVPSAE